MSTWLGNMYGVITVVLMLLFIGIWVWAWSRGNKKNFDEAARMPMEDAHRDSRIPDDKKDQP